MPPIRHNQSIGRRNPRERPLSLSQTSDNNTYIFVFNTKDIPIETRIQHTLEAIEEGIHNLTQAVKEFQVPYNRLWNSK
jgi:hypothetical protein